MPKAAPSTRSSGHITLSFGLVNIPVDLYSGTVSDHGVERHEYLTLPVMEPATDDQGQPVFDAEGKPVMVQATKEVEKEDGTTETVKVYEDHLIGRGLTNKTTGDLLSPAQRSQIVKKIETEYGPVYVEDGEIEHLFSITPNSVVVKGFQPQHLFHQGQYVPKSLMHVIPRVTGSGKNKGPDPVATKLLLTMFKSMKEKGAMGVVEITTRGIPKPGILLPDGTLWQVWPTDALREQKPLPAEAHPSQPVLDAEVAMFGTLIDTMWSTEAMDLTDERSALIQDFADKKAAAGDFAKPDEVEVQVAQPAGSVDLMALLAASVDQAKKDLAAEEAS